MDNVNIAESIKGGIYFNVDNMVLNSEILG